jgi:prepilin-type N-terminal cleavage/methylation domain-containing protein
MGSESAGFTLVEIAIVLVIIGLLVGGVLSGQELIRSARVRGLVAQQEGVKAAIYGFQDRYRALPGDYSGAETNITCAAVNCFNGDGNGRIEAPNSAGAHEEIYAWSHLAGAGFITGSYRVPVSTVDEPTPENTPTNAYGAYMHLGHDNVWGVSTNAAQRHNVKTGHQIPVVIMAEVDRKIDDGHAYSGAFQFSRYVDHDTFLDPGGESDNSCTNGDIIDPGQPMPDWNEAVDQSDCGGTSFF